MAQADKNQMEKLGNKRTLRGSALTELTILLLPYGLCLIGVIVLGHLALGRQETQKACLLMAPRTTDTTATDFTFMGWSLNGYSQTARYVDGSDGRFSAERTTDPPSQNYATEEPALPYSKGEDIHAAFVRLGVYSRQVITRNTATGELSAKTETYRNSIGYYLSNYDIAVIPTDLGGTTTTGGRETDLATLLNEWQSFAGARGKYAFAFGGSALPFETGASESKLRDDFAIYGSDGDEGIIYYAVGRNTNDLAWRGTHQLQSSWQSDSSGVPFTYDNICTRLTTETDTALAQVESITYTVNSISKTSAVDPYSLPDEESYNQSLWDCGFSGE